MTKNWKHGDLRGTEHLLAEFRAAEESRIADKYNLKAWEPGKYRAGWTLAEKRPRLNPYHLAVDEFETPDDRWLYSPTVKAKDYSVAGEGNGQVKVLGSDYDI
jgi:hypothetical protein